MDAQVNPEIVINDLLEQNKQLTLQLSVMRAALAQAHAAIEQMQKEPTPKRGK